jgi:hypothetical protein
MELANLRAALATLTLGDVPTMTLSLPASKVDTAAIGVSRSHACLCGDVPQPDCPVHAAWDQHLALRSHFGARFTEGAPAVDLPFFPDTAGRPVSKSCMAATIAHAAALLGIPAVNREGTFRVSGHSLRPTGAQGLARLGLDVWAVQLLGRWGSGTVLEYVRDAAASPEAAVARRTLLGQNLQDFHAARRGGATVEEVTARALAEIQTHLPRFLADLRATLLADAFPGGQPAPARAPSSSSSASSSSSSSPSSSASPSVRGLGFQVYVSSGSRATRHLVAVAPTADLVRAAWQTSCGWHFGLSEFAREPVPEDADCRRCFPAGLPGSPHSGVSAASNTDASLPIPNTGIGRLPRQPSHP